MHCYYEYENLCYKHSRYYKTTLCSIAELSFTFFKFPLAFNTRGFSVAHFVLWRWKPLTGQTVITPVTSCFIQLLINYMLNNPERQTQTVFSPSVIVLNFNLSWTRCVWFVVNSSFSGNCKAIERGSYVTAGYGRHRGECGLLLLLPTLLFHLIIWPPCWLKACCMVTWWLSHPHCCQMKALSCVIKLGKPLRNHKKNQPNFNQIAYNSN